MFPWNEREGNETRLAFLCTVEPEEVGVVEQEVVSSVYSYGSSARVTAKQDLKLRIILQLAAGAKQY